MKTIGKIATIMLSGVLATSVLTSCKANKTEEEITPKADTTVTTTATTTTKPIETTTEEFHSPNIEYYVKKSEPADLSYFDDVIFVGDSISNMFRIFEMEDNALGNAEFLCATSLSPYNALWDLNAANNRHPDYYGQKVRVPHGVKLSGRKKVYILLGSNGTGGGRGQQNVEYLKQLVDEIKALVPDATFYMQSLTPVNQKCKSPTKEDVDGFNVALSNACKENGWYFIDVASVLYDKDGYLPIEWCADWDPEYMHPNKEGYKLWAEYILTHTA